MSELTQTNSVKSLLNSDAVKQRFAEMLGKNANGFLVSVMNAVNSNSSLQKCEPNSILMAAATAASLNLPVDNNLGHSYIIPYGAKAQFQIGYKGFKQLAMRSGQFITLHATDVREGEIIDNNRLTGEIQFSWIQNDRERISKPVIGYVSYFKLSNGFEQTYYMTIEELNFHGKKYSKMYASGLWKTDFHNMALKTVIKQNLSKNAPLSIEMQTAIKADQAAIAEDGTFEYVDNQPVNPHELAAQKEAERTMSFIKEATTIEQLEQVEGYLINDELIFAYDEQYSLIEKNTAK